MCFLKNKNYFELFIDKKIIVKLNVNEKIEGILIGFDQFSNLILKESTFYERKKKKRIGIILIRGSVVNSIES